MITEKETVRCEAIFNDERTHRYLWKQVWNKDKPLVCVVMLNPCSADCLIYDTTTYLVVNNIASLDKYGGVEIVNIYSKLTNKLSLRWDSDTELNGSDNDTYIRKSAAECEIVILAWGTGATTNKRVQQRVKNVLTQLKPFTKKLLVITDGEELRGIHPLTPAVRNQWILSPYQLSDFESIVKAKTVKSADNSPVASTSDTDSLIPDDSNTTDKS